MRRTIVILLCAGLFGLLASLLVHFPAGHAVALMAPPGVTASGVGGSVWRGSARQVEYGGPVPLLAVSWSLSAPRLLTGKLALEADFEVAGGQAEVAANIAHDGEITVRDATFRGPASAVAPLLPLLPGVSVEGDIIARISHGRWRDGRPQDIQARILWDHARLRAPASVLLGSVAAEIRPQAEGGHRMTLENRDGALVLDGEGNAGDDGRYELLLRLRPGTETPADVVDLLRRNGERDNGHFVIRDSGRLELQ